MKSNFLKGITAGFVCFLMTGVIYSQGNGTCTGTQQRIQSGTQSHIQNQTQSRLRDQSGTACLNQLQSMSGTQVCTQSNARVMNKSQMKMNNGQNAQKQNAYRKMNAAQNQTGITNNERFRNSLTADQVSILENKEMTRNQKREAFRNSLTAEQLDMIGGR
jgi:hypothetical protein